ncbi:MAG: hypothetical protein E7093_01045 [Bacteroidales bacterium]|nr:hypothetical protein [Bacteroidales bacterium]
MNHSFKINENISNSGWQPLETKPLSIDGNKNPKVYILVTSKTGIHILESMIMLCASGYIKDIEIVPIIFSLDMNCATLARIIKELKLYRNIHKIGNSRIFFNAAITPLIKPTPHPQQTYPKDEPSFEFLIQTEDTTIWDKYNLDVLANKEPNSAVIKFAESLFGVQNDENAILKQVNTKYSPLHTRLMVGNLSHDLRFQHLRDAIDINKDKIILIGSTFETTGVTLTHELACRLQSISASKSLIIANPIPSATDDEFTTGNEYIIESSRNSLLFFENTDIYSQFNMTYFLATNIHLQANSGGRQEPPNSIHEIWGALSIVDFCTRQISYKPQIVTYNVPDFCNDEICIEDINGTPRLRDIIEPLTRFALSMRYVKDSKDTRITDELEEFRKFFYNWIYVMSTTSKPKMNIFNLSNGGIHEIVKGRELYKNDIIYQIYHGGKKRPLFTLNDFMVEMERLQTINGDSIDFLQKLAIAADFIYKKFYNL